MTHPDRRQLPPSYPDDLVAVMRDTITAQREALAAKDQVIAGLQAHLEACNRTLEEGAQTMTLAKVIVGSDRERREKIAHLEACNDQLRIAEAELRRELARVRSISAVPQPGCSCPHCSEMRELVRMEAAT
jgi:hypothetical protein